MSYADHRALIDQIDTMLHNTSVAVYDATTKQKRKDIDDQITDARIELDKLRSRFE